MLELFLVLDTVALSFNNSFLASTPAILSVGLCLLSSPFTTD